MNPVEGFYAQFLDGFAVVIMNKDMTLNCEDAKAMYKIEKNTTAAIQSSYW